ncbi:universal stress protein [Pseudonocardia xishanensis]|uniref:Universal stress protein n=1 Tax=Pseudonocardia xishanensis TaxID=630995 RepID=A0ABP8RTB4_9PSEU
MTSHHREIVVGVDGSPSSGRAAVWAADEAAQRRLPLRVVHALETTVLTYGAWVAPPQSFFDELRAEGERIVVEARATALRRHPGLDVSVAVYPAGPVPALLDESLSAELVVIGAHGRGDRRSLLLGSCVVTVAEHARCPVAVIRGHDEGPPPTRGPVVVGVDGSPIGDAAVAAAFDEASWRGTGLTAVHAWTDPFASLRRGDAEAAAVEAGERTLLAERLAGWGRSTRTSPSGRSSTATTRS